jgi:hypothetical protein
MNLAISTGPIFKAPQSNPGRLHWAEQRVATIDVREFLTLAARKEHIT